MKNDPDTVAIGAAGGGFGRPYLCTGQDLGRDDLVGAKGLSRIDKGSKDFTGLSTFTC